MTDLEDVQRGALADRPPAPAINGSNIMELRLLTASECSIVSGAGDTVTFYDNDRNGVLSEGDEILYYTVDGVEMSPGAYEAFTNWDSFSDFGGAIDWIFDNPFEFGGLVLDTLDEANRAAELSGSEYIDWKTGGWHRDGGGAEQPQ